MWKRLLKETKHAASSAASNLATRKRPSASPPPAPTHSVSPAVLLRLKQAASSKKAPSPPPNAPHDGSSSLDFAQEILSVLNGHDDDDADADADVSGAVPGGESDDAGVLGNKILDMEWSVTAPSSKLDMTWRKVLLRERTKRHIFKNAESRRFSRLMQLSATKLGAETALEFFAKLGRVTGVKEFNAMIRFCLDNAERCSDDDVVVDQIHRVYQLFVTMRDRGFQIKEASYGPFLLYLVDMEMTQEFEVFSKFFKDANPQSYLRIAYYEMLLWIRVKDENKIRELCHSVEHHNDEAHHQLGESYLLAFAKSGRKMDFISLLEVLDVKKFSKSEYTCSLFKSLGRFELENYAEELLQEMSSKESADGEFSFFIFNYAANLPNIVVEDIVMVFTTWHEKFKVTPALAAYANMISLCCRLSKVCLALDVADSMCQSNPNVPIESFHPIIQACEQGCELDMVHPIYDLMRRHKLKPKSETFKSMISLCVKMKDFEGAYNMLTDAEEIGGMSTVSLYNAIMFGYFREKNHNGVLMVMAQMQIAGVKPDSETFSYLISNCESEECISKYHNELRQAGVEKTKYVYLALINAYSRLGNFDMAKQVLLDHEIPPKHLNFIKSALVAALASNGQISDGLKLYKQIKKSGCSLEPRAAISLIDHIQTEGERDILYQLLEELTDSSSWFDGCSRVVLYCVQKNYADSAIELLKKFMERDEMSAHMVVDQVFCQIWSMDPVNLDFGMEFLHAVKGLGLNISRTSLDFFLSACAKAKDARCSEIWAEYESAGLPHNVLSSLRMYQALLSSGNGTAAKEMLRTIPKEDAHVRYVINSCKMTYNEEVATLTAD